MEEMKARLEKLREERLAREKARIDKLRELNLKKYTKDEIQHKPTAITKKIDPTKKVDPIKKFNLPKKTTLPVKNIASNRTVNNPIKNTTKLNAPKITNTAQVTNIPKITNIAQVANIPKTTNAIQITNVITEITKAAGDATASNKDTKTENYNIKKTNLNKTVGTIQNISENHSKIPEKPTRKSMIPNIKTLPNSRKSIAPTKPIPPRDSRKSFIPKGNFPLNPIQPKDSRKTLMPKISESKESVFDRLYKPKMVKNGLNASKLDKDRVQTDAKFREKLIKQSNLLLNKRHTVFEPRPQGSQKPGPLNPQVRRSISAVHFKRIAKNELANCFHKWASSENIDKLALNGNEDDGVQQDKVISAIKSDRKKVNFKKPISMNFNTPKPAELQARLKEWLQKRGKAIDTYHHLQCFGLHHMAKNSYSVQKSKQILDDENKENIELTSDSDNDSYSESMGQKWRRASAISSNDFNDTKETISEIEMHREDDLVVGALNDLTDLLREGFDWEQSARWLRAIRERFPSASELAAYWECRAALEEQQGNLPATVHCWGEAVAKGTERSVVEANLDQLLDKFMQLKISPRSAKKKQINPKLVDVKNVFKSTIIRFAVQQAKIRQSAQQEAPKFTITPVRRSGRVSISHSLNKPKTIKDMKFLTPHGKRTPLVQICSSLTEYKDAEFVPNDVLPCTP